ncbi:MAG: hypothetical protein J6C33_08665 [Lachnospiraceae bacterium]|nr:hypothetical protein [Lachnospiraceae bacterium]
MQKRKKENDPALQKKRIRKRKEKVWIAEVLSVLCVIAVRVFAAARYGFGGAQADSYAAAMISGDGAVVLTGRRVSDLYLCFLSVLFRFFGNKAEIAVFAQLLLQCAAIFIFAAALKKLLGSAAVISFLLAASFVPHFLFEYHRYSPDLLVCLLSGCVFYAAACLIRSIGAGKRLVGALLLLITCVLAGGLIWLILPEFQNGTDVSYTNLYTLICLAVVCAGIQGIINGFCALRAVRRKQAADGQADAVKAGAAPDKMREKNETLSPEAETERGVREAAPESGEPEKQKINYIPNPLPLPKKHVKKVMGFDLDTDTGDRLLDFDYQGTDGDDFDI